MGKYEGHSQIALHPKSTEHVSQIMKHCNQRRLAVVPQVGFTHLTMPAVFTRLQCMLACGGERIGSYLPSQLLVA